MPGASVESLSSFILNRLASAAAKSFGWSMSPGLVGGIVARFYRGNPSQSIRAMAKKTTQER